ncbi:PAS domain S-box protein [Psychroserpens damuponensis]|uniref:PAS domain S-box protein n=1 Tax=Psychroserpens damuponensis TaxID=943936 RepID=UPI00058FC8FE|nr:PAS domain S-box protein [Psychroserpens damuponensis]
MSHTDLTLIEQLNTIYGFSQDYLESFEEGVLIFNTDGKLLMVNEATCKMCGYQRADIIGLQSAFPFWPSNKYDEYGARFKKVLRNNLNGEFESLHQHKNGELFPVSIFFASIRNPKNDVIAHLALIQDYSNFDNSTPELAQNKEIFSVLNYRKKYLELIAKNKASSQLKTTLNNISDGFISLDTDWYYTYVNKKAAALIGRTPRSLVGKHIWTEFPEGVGQSFYKAYHKAFETQETLYFEDYYEPLGKWFENRIYPSPEGITIYFTDITEKKETETNNQKLLSLIETSDDFVGLATLDGIPTYLNVNGRKLIGLEPNEDLPNSIGHVFPKDYQSKVASEHMPAMFNKNKWNGEAVFQNLKTGALIPIEMSGFLIKNKISNEPIALGIVASDISKRKATEDKLIESEQLFKRLTSKAPAGIFQTDKNGSCSYVNESWSAYADLTFDEAMGYGWAATIHPDDKDRIMLEWEKYVISGKKELETQFRFLHTNNNVIWVTVKTVGTYDAQNNLYGYIGMAIDVTDAKKAEEKLMKSEEVFKRLSANAPVAIFQTDIDGGCNYVNEEWMKYSGLTLDEARGFGWVSTLHPEDKDRVLDAWEKSIVSGVNFKLDCRILHKDNHVTWVSAKTVGLYDANQELYGYIGMLLDITERKVAEEKLITSEQLFRRLSSNAPVGIYQTNDQGYCNYVNEEWIKYSGLTYADSMGYGWSEAIHPEDRDRVLDEWEINVSSELESLSDFRLRNKKGEIKWVSAKTTRLYNSNNKFYGYIGTIVDVTEQKESEEKLLNSEQLFRRLSSHAPVGIFQTDKDGVCNYVNQEWIKYSGITFEEALGFGWSNALHPEDKERVLKIWEQALLEGKEYNTDFRFLSKQGKTTWLSAKAVGLYDANNNINGYIGTLLDITERKEAVIKLMKNEQLLRELTSNAPVAIVKTTKRGGCSFVNEEFMKYTGLSFEESLGLNWTKAVHPQDKEFVLKEWLEVVNNEKDFITEFRFVDKKGKITWVSVKVIGLFNTKNELEGYVGTCIDITEQRNSVERIKQSENYLNNIINNIGDPVFVKDENSRMILVNDALCALFNLTRDSIIGNTLAGNVPINERERFLNIDKEVLSTGVENVNIETLSFGSKKKRTISTKKTRFIDSNGKKFLIGVIRDITARRKAEEEIRMAHQRLTTHLNNSPLAVVEWDKDFFITSWSAQAEKIFGWNEIEAIGKQLVDLNLVYEEDIDSTNEISKELRSGKVKSNKIINRNNTKTGEVIYCQWYNSLLLTSDGEVETVLSLIMDVTERVEADKLIKDSEEKFSKVFQSNLIGYSIVNKDEVRIDANETLARILETNRANLIGKTFEEAKVDILDDAYFEQKKWITEKIHAEGFLNNETITRKLISGKEISLLTSLEEIEIAGETHALFAVVDITDKTKAEIALKENEEKFSKAFNSKVIGKAILDKEKRIVEVNETLANIVGFTREDMLGNTAQEIGLFNFDNQKNLDNEDKLWGQFSEKGYVSNIELNYQMQTGKELFLSISLQALQLNHEGHVLISVIDITEKKNVEAELENHRNNLEELIDMRTSELEKEKVKAQSADLMKSAFLATMSHELRTPMNSIIGFTGILLKELAGPLNEEQRKQLTMVKNSGEHLLGLINDVLDISKIEAGKLKVSFYAFNFLSLLEKTIEFILPQASRKGLKISTEISDLDVIIISDERRIEQILLNLLSNAIKFSDKGTILVKVNIKNDVLTTQVIDQGIGIKKADVAKLFMPFIQLEDGLSRKHEGTGLGLAICKSLVEKLGGTISVKSEIGKGSNFSFKLPLDYMKKE